MRYDKEISLNSEVLESRKSRLGNENLKILTQDVRLFGESVTIENGKDRSAMD